ncbi:hypothetical protein E2C01_098329 [Portunus trituberculatus]|uniref:Uncharacterized protein n=1 Tax=Portunus trituberculatus TaxID=210409 RepID=A0A5B7K0Z1_PORTR|nr:hypothetical protein [Portunus trituberculatus]
MKNEKCFGQNLLRAVTALGAALGEKVTVGFGQGPHVLLFRLRPQASEIIIHLQCLILDKELP